MRKALKDNGKAGVTLKVRVPTREGKLLSLKGDRQGAIEATFKLKVAAGDAHHLEILPPGTFGVGARHGPGPLPEFKIELKDRWGHLVTNKPTVELSVTGPYQLHGSATFTGDAHGCVKVPEGSITASPDCYGQQGRLSIKGAGKETTYPLLAETRELRWMTAEGEVMADNEFVADKPDVELTLGLFDPSTDRRDISVSGGNL